MNEKEKTKREGRFGIIKSCLIFSLYPIIICISLCLLLTFWVMNVSLKTTLDSQYIPTAQYLLEHPIEISHTDTGLSIQLDTNSLLQYHWVCFNVTSSSLDDFNNLAFAEIIVNEHIANRLDLGLSMAVRETETPHSHPCLGLNERLNSGIHIIEIRVKSHLFAEPYYIHRWAIEIP